MRQDEGKTAKLDQDPSLESEDTNLLQIKVVLGPQGMCMPVS